MGKYYIVKIYNIRIERRSKLEKVECLYEILNKFTETFEVKYRYANIGIIKKFRIDSRKNLEIDEEKWCRLFLKKSSLNYCAKFLLLRVFEDKGKINSKLNKFGIEIWNKLVKNIKESYDKLYDIAIEDIKNEEEFEYIRNIFIESDYDIYVIDKELARIIVDGFVDFDFTTINNKEIIEVFMMMYPLDDREELKLEEFYKEAPALNYILNLK